MSLFNIDEYNALPDALKPKTAICEKHGQVEIRVIDTPFLKKVLNTCHKCCTEKRADEERLELERQAKQAEDRFIKHLIDCGVSERHIDSTFDNYIADTDKKVFALNTVKSFSDAFINGDHGNAILSGNVGTGKNHLATALMKEVYTKSKKKAVITTVVKMIRHYRSTWSKESNQSEDDILRYYSRVDLLIIDELGIQKGSEDEKNTLFEILNNRYESRLPTVILTNKTLQEVKEILGDRVIDRLKEDGCKTVVLNWESHRVKEI